MGWSAGNKREMRKEQQKREKERNVRNEVQDNECKNKKVRFG